MSFNLVFTLTRILLSIALCIDLSLFNCNFLSDRVCDPYNNTGIVQDSTIFTLVFISSFMFLQTFLKAQYDFQSASLLVLSSFSMLSSTYIIFPKYLYLISLEYHFPSLHLLPLSRSSLLLFYPNCNGALLPHLSLRIASWCSALPFQFIQLTSHR